MLWVREKKVVRHIATGAAGLLEIPVRVRFEFAVERSLFVEASMQRWILYNRDAAIKRLNTTVEALDADVDVTVDQALQEHLRFNGLTRRVVTLYAAAQDPEPDPEPPPRIILPGDG